ncbi:hypothetical protein BLOT_002481 [Blomia tropicalis]|nr:hypothetical protein BLOT_002481 [Blomia tropicalis]
MSKASLTSLARTEEDAFVISEKDDEISPFMFASDGSMDGPIGSQLILYQIAAIAIKCQHNSLLVSSLHSPRKSTGIWLPYVCVKEKYKCLQLPALIAEFILKQLNEPCDVEMMLQNQTTLPFEKVSLHDITRIQMPNGKFITRYTFIARWKCNEFSCCTDSLHLKWIPVNSIYEPTSKATTKFYQNLIERFWGSEVGLYAVENKYEGVRTRYNELSCNEVFRYVKRSDSDNNDNNGKARNATTELFIKFVTDSKFMEKDVIRLYSDFIQHCYPSTNMSLTSFTDYCRKTGLGKSFESNKQFSRLFRAMNYKVKHYLTFNEFLLGLVCLDPESPHCLPRYTFIFRFYDSNQDGKLESNDLKLLLNDLSVEDKELSKSDLNLKQFIDEIESSSISKKFLKTSSLCRESNSIIRLLNNANVYDLISYSEKPFSSGVDTNCIKCRPKHYTLATHSVKLTSFGRIMTPKTTVFDADQNTPTMLKLLRTHSNEFIFKPSASANYVLEVTRKLANYNNKTEAERKDVRNEVVNAISASVITRICEEVCELLSAETRVLQVSTPTLVMGDIHGNMHDLLTFEMQLWPMAPAEIGPNVLFLGDYVDRGEFSIEVVLYLFCMKILAPNKFFLLRGNHEVRQIQKVFTFEKECLDKYGTHGPIVYETFNRAFDQLPFAAIIDESIYCAHGGIPCSVTSIEELNRQPSLLSDPEQEAPAVWEILWSDPITAPEYQQLSEFMNKKDGSGYLPNMKRSTAFYFSEIATNNFLKKNKLSRVIRAHEVINEGFRLNHRGSVITIFSCSRYCGGPNKAAAIVVEAFEQDGYLKIISLDT